ncbi:unnamed protein product [Prunus armeniaca]
MDGAEKPAVVPTETTETDEELREAFEAIKQEKEQGFPSYLSSIFLHEEIYAEVIAKSIELAKKQQEVQRTEPTTSELALFDEVEAEHSAAAPAPKVEEDRIARILPVLTSPLKPLIVAVSSSTTASFVDPELAEFEAMDLDAQLDKLEKLSSTPGKAKSKVVDEAVDRVKIWQSTKLDLDENREVVDQLKKDLDLLHRENMAPWPILEINLGLSRDVLNLHYHYEDLKPSFKTFEFCKATYEANLETKTAAYKLEKHIEELQKQLTVLRDRQNKLGAGLEYGLSFQASSGNYRRFYPPRSAPPKRDFHQEDQIARNP